jgi:hypothetical protein
MRFSGIVKPEKVGPLLDVLPSFTAHATLPSPLLNLATKSVCGNEPARLNAPI